MSNLIRKRDGEGYHGSVVNAIDPDSYEIVGHTPMIGCYFYIGTLTAGTFSTRDWWRTTVVTEIVSEDNDTIIFKTNNSEYTLRK